MATKATGKAKKTIGITMNKEMADELEARAESMNISASKYIKIIMAQWLESGKKLKLAEK